MLAVTVTEPAGSPLRWNDPSAAVVSPGIHVCEPLSPAWALTHTPAAGVLSAFTTLPARRRPGFIRMVRDDSPSGTGRLFAFTYSSREAESWTAPTPSGPTRAAPSAPVVHDWPSLRQLPFSTSSDAEIRTPASGVPVASSSAVAATKRSAGRRIATRA